MADDRARTIEQLRRRITDPHQYDGEPNGFDIATLRVLEAGRIADSLENIETILGTALGAGSPLVSALRGAATARAEPTESEGLRLAREWCTGYGHEALLRNNVKRYGIDVVIVDELDDAHNATTDKWRPIGVEDMRTALQEICKRPLDEGGDKKETTDARSE